MENRVPALLAEKFGGADKIVVQRIVGDMGGKLPYSTVERWVKDDVNRIDLHILEKWCQYFDLPVGEILVYVPDKE